MLTPEWSRGRTARRAVAEAVGTCLLVAVVVGSGIAAVRLVPGQAGLQLLINALVTGAGLLALILCLAPVSAAFNPVVTLAERALGALTWRQTGALVGAQCAGGVVGSVLANVMFGLPASTLSTHVRSGGDLWLSEAVATGGLLLVVLGTSRTAAHQTVAVAVAGWITAAYWFTPSTSFANPAVTLGRALTDTFAGIAPSSVPGFVLAQLLGGALALSLVRYLLPGRVAVRSATTLTEAGVP